MLDNTKWDLLAASAALLVISSVAVAQGTPARLNPNVYYRLQTAFQGPNKAMDVINDGTNNRMHMVDVGPYTGQFWRFSPFPGYPGGYRISCYWQGLNKPMDVINGGNDDNQTILANLGPYSGQLWYMFPVPGTPYHWMTTQFRGPNYALEGAAVDGTRPRLDPRGNFTGQFWNFDPLFSVDPATVTSFGSGCNSGNGNMSLIMSNQPWVGETLRGVVNNVPTDAPACELLFGLRQATPLPIYQSPGCVLLVDIAVQLTLPAPNGVANLTLPIPNDVNLVGGVLPMQALAIRPRGAAPRIPSSNGVELKFGLR